MNPEVKTIWLTALQSGEYKKGRMSLRNDVDGNEEYQYCCLGVLCEEYRKATGHGTWDFDIFIDGTKDRHITILTRDVVAWAGLSSCNPIVIHGEYSSLADLNDATDTFTDVINVIEEHL
jgi:hypothetical protein